VKVTETTKDVLCTPFWHIPFSDCLWEWNCSTSFPSRVVSYNKQDY